EELRADTLRLIAHAGIDDLVRPWVRMVSLARASEDAAVYDPSDKLWFTLGAAERAALAAWSRTPLPAVRGMLARGYGSLRAEQAIATAQALVNAGHFGGHREVDAPLEEAGFLQLLEEIVRDLQVGQIGPRPEDRVSVRAAQRAAERRSLVLVGSGVR